MKKTVMHLRGLILLVCCILAASITFAQNNQWGKWCYKDYSNPNGPNPDKSYTFTVPAGCTKIYFEAVGGGGAGGFVYSTGYGGFLCADETLPMSKYYKVSGGGGGGAYGLSYTLTTSENGLTPGETFTIVVGAGGRSEAQQVMSDEYDADCNSHTLLGTCRGWEYHNQWKKCWHGSWPVNYGTILNPDIHSIEWPFFKNYFHSDGGKSSVTRNSDPSAPILEANGGMSAGDNSTVGAAGGAATGAGKTHFRGGNGGDAAAECGLADADYGKMSTGGGGAAGNPTGSNPDAPQDAHCANETGFGHAGTGYQTFGIEDEEGYGGEGTSDWAWDADGHNGSHGDSGHPGGGAGGGSKIGVWGWCSGGNGGDGFVRVWFYIEAPALSVNPTASEDHISAPKNVTLNAGVSNNLIQSGIFETQYKWNPSNKTDNPIEEYVSETTTYRVTVTNICKYATNSNACSVTSNAPVTVTVDPVSAGSISASNATWVCSPGDTVVTITSTTPASPYPGGTYSWQYSTNGSSWETIPDANEDNFTVGISTDWYKTGYYKRCYTYGSTTVCTDPPVQVTRPSDITPGMVKDASGNTTTNVCSGGNVSVNLTAGNTDYTVIWEKKTIDETDWTPITDGVTPLSINNLTTTTYVRYVVKYTNSCGVPSNNHYTLNVWKNPEVLSITPSSTCPNQTSYELTADVTKGSNDNLHYYWTGDADNIDANPGTITPNLTDLPNCAVTYSYSLYVIDDNYCTSNTLSSVLTIDEPELQIGAIANVAATNSAACEFKVPDVNTLKAAVNAALISPTCGNEVNLSSFNLQPGDIISSNQTVTATATDMCGHTKSVEISVIVPELPIVEISTSSILSQYLCPGETTTLTVHTDAVDPHYHWYPESLGEGKTATTIAYTGEDVEVHPTYYYVVVTDGYGCQSNGGINIYTTPKAYILNKTYEICTPAEATLDLTADDKVPTGNTTLSSGTFTYTTTYSWTITDNTGVTGATNATDQANFTTGTLTNSTLTTQTVTYSVLPTTVTNFDGTDVTSCDGDAFTITVEVKPTITTTGAITNFDNADVIITLWYGACDTLYNVITPTYTNNTDLDVTLTNDKGGTVNAGPLLGRIAPGEYTIEWKLTDECGNEVTYTKKYIVRYPNCGEDDPNYTEPYRVTYDGYTYTTVRIGCECWLKENLRNQVDADGNNIAVAKVYQNDDSHLNPFGRLYTWYSAMGVTEDDNTAVPTTAQGRLGIYTPGICPEGWAIPKDAQFEDMMTYAHNNTREASSKNQAYWLPGAAGIDPNNGFEAVGAGYYDHYADFYYNLLAETHFWTSTPSSTTYKGKCVTFTHICPEMIKEEMMKGNAISVRCVKIEPKPILD